MRTLIALFILLSFGSTSHARLFIEPSHHELTEQSEVVVILEPITTKRSVIPYNGDLHGYKPDHFEAWITTFKVHAVFKGKIDVKSTVKILHFTYAQGSTIAKNGAFFMTFPTTGLNRKITYLGGDKHIVASTHNNYIPIWLCYLKVRADGVYEPVSNQYDAGLSFREVAPR